MLDLEVIAKLKTDTALALAATLSSSPARASEKDIADQWLSHLRADDTLYQDGWYDPPPHGVVVLCGQAKDRYIRINQPSFRPEPMWPQDAERTNSETMLAVYASPVHKATNFIGDFGASLYRGGDASIWKHIEKVLTLTFRIAGLAEPGMAFSQLYNQAIKEIEREGLSNRIESATDATGTNIGHTIPLSYQSDQTHAAIIGAGSFAEIRKALSAGRKFINRAESQLIEPDIAFTIEPRLSTKELPSTWFHLTVMFSGGKRTICHGLKPVFEKAGMENLIPLLTSLSP